MNDQHFDSIVLLLNPNKNKKYFFFQAKLQRLQKIEDQIDMEKEDKTDANDDSDTFLKRLIESIIRNLEVTITDVHIRYEDKHSNQG